jgi:hypothetical protein
MDLNEIFLRNRGRTLQTRMDAETYAEGVLRSFEAGEVGDGTFTYDDESGNVQRFMVAGSGPTVYVVFINMGDDGNDLTAHLEYIDSDGRVILPLPDYRVEEMLSLFLADKEERDSR